MKTFFTFVTLLVVLPLSALADTVDPYENTPQMHDRFGDLQTFEFDALEVLQDSYRTMPGSAAQPVVPMICHALGILILAGAVARLAPHPRRHALWAASAMSRMR